MNLHVPKFINQHQITLAVGTAGLVKLLTVKSAVFAYSTTDAWGFTPLDFSLHFCEIWSRVNGNFGFLSYALRNSVAQLRPGQLASLEPSPMWMGQTLDMLLLSGSVMVGLLASFYVIHLVWSCD